MATVLTPEVLKDDIAVSVARVLAAANKRAREAGIDLDQSLITVVQNALNGKTLWRVNYGPRDYVGRRGGDFMVEVDGSDARITQIMWGQ
jgi:hypothetical protein